MTSQPPFAKPPGCRSKRLPHVCQWPPTEPWRLGCPAKIVAGNPTKLDWLVVEVYPFEKYEFVNLDDDIPNTVYGKIKFMFQTTNKTWKYMMIGTTITIMVLSRANGSPSTWVKLSHSPQHDWSLSSQSPWSPILGLLNPKMSCFPHENAQISIKPPWLATPQTSRLWARHAHSRVSRAFPVSIQRLGMWDVVS